MKHTLVRFEGQLPLPAELLDEEGDVKAARIVLGTLTWTFGSGAPTGSCTTGSFYSRTDGGSGVPALYARAGGQVRGG